MTGRHSVSSVRIEIQKIDYLPPMPTIAQEILIASNDNTSDMDDIAKIIKKDPGLTAKIIGMANSAFFGFGRNVSTLEQAIINVLGLDLVKGFALSLAMSSVFDPDKCANFDLKRYWASAFITAELASGFTNHIDSKQVLDPNQLYLYGLLHNIGILVLTNRFPNIMSELFMTAREDKEKRLIEYEKETIDFNHHDAGAWLGHKWKLPYEMIDVIERHHDLDYQDRNSNFVILIGYCSRISRQWLLDTHYDPMEDIEVINKLNFKADSLKKYLDKSHEKLDGIQNLVDEIAG
ncbi:MAG: HDOD domain-containing protein [Proteobacteria bacterium]|nr:HDOD domain-containing protein [Pseudomonadota bacterium]NOG59875.1 HDOD domain-containing protein [Pseudomonadota bacterium]